MLAQQVDLNSVLARYRASIGSAVHEGRLPRGIGVTVKCADAGMFVSLNVEVIKCEVLVVDPDAAVKAALPTLNRAGEHLKRTLLHLANENAGVIGAVVYARDLLADQVKFLRGLEDRAALEGRLWAPPSPANTSAPLAAELPAGKTHQQMVSSYAVLADRVMERLQAGTPFMSADLFKMADEAFGGTQGEGAYTAKDAYEACELATNRHIRSLAATWTVDGDADHAARVVREIEALSGLLPTQTRRDAEMVALQQYSTPPALGYVVAWAAGVTPSDVVLEPSAGTGNLAVHALNAGAKVHVNEISERRRLVLKAQGYEPTGENAEQVHNILAAKLTPTVVLMNPPFSTSIRTGETRDVAVAGQHVEAALKLLADGGRLVAITGRSTGSAGGRGSWLTRIRSKYAVRANVIVGGGAFRAFGTSIETRLVVIDKVASDSTAPVMGQADTVEQLVHLLAPVRRTVAAAEEGADTDTRFAPYRPMKLRVPGVKPHPGRLVESWAMAAVAPPDIWYRPAFPEWVISEGRISDAQLEAVCYAGQAHSQWLAANTDGVPWRRGFYIGDGMGVGKGREISAIILDNWYQGEQRAVWVTKDDTKLLKAARRDFKAVGGDAKLVFPLRGTPAGQAVQAAQGVMVVSFGGLRSNRPGKSRVEQIVEWCGGPEFTGVLVIDEAHKLGNALDEDGGRGRQKASQTALSGIALQAALPRARVVYVSATSASEVKNFAYADRLGIYGPGTPFASKRDFVQRIEAGGVASMEIIARDLKAMGLFCARSLSYSDVKFDRLVHNLSPAQVETYNLLADAWNVVLSNLDEAMDAAGSRGNAAARSAALSAFWGSSQRFWNQVLTSMQLPTVIRAMERDLADGHACVVQLVNTLEAQQERALAKEGALEALEDLDLTPRDILMQYLEASFPVTAYEEYQDEDGNTQTRAVRDSNGHLVTCAEAVQMRTEMLAAVGALKVPHGPLEAIIDHFGADQVAEITGRSRRVVTLPDPDTGLPTRRIQNRTENARLAEIEAFANDERRILIFSNAANTGIDLHASLDCKNQRLRKHYVVQAGWNAKECTQALGRTHRTNQRQAPEYILVTTNLRGQLRFITSIARRLGQLGALTKGQRDTGSQGLLSERDNLEGVYGTAAVSQIVHELYFGRDVGLTVGGFTLDDFEIKLGLRVRDEQGNLLPDRIPPVRQFLNRILALRVDDQNRFFEEFQDRLDEQVQAAVDAGIFNQGVEVYQADQVEVVAAPRTVFVDPATSAETRYVHLRAKHRRIARNFARVASGICDWRRRQILGWVVAVDTDEVFAVASARARANEEGAIIPQVRLIGPYAECFEDAAEIDAGTAYSLISEAEAEERWLKASDAGTLWSEHELHMICGVLLPVWDRLEAGGKVYRVVDDTGAQHLGRLLHPGKVRATLAKLGAHLGGSWTAAEVVDAVLAGETIDLANGWRLKRARVSGNHRVELVGWPHADMKRLEDLGLMREIIQYQTRMFVPTMDDAAMASLLRAAPVVEEPGEVAQAA